MHIDSPEAAAGVHVATGPRTEQGKARSSRNALRTGLYAARDFVRPAEEEEYGQTILQIMDELAPEGILEETFATEIMGATWRLRRCRLVEESFSTFEDLDTDPMVDEKTARAQRSVDRARAQSHLILRRSMAELRRLQANRPPARCTRDELRAMAKADFDALLLQAGNKQAASKLGSFCKSGESLPAALAPVTSFCKPGSATPRNAVCPCGSGAKFKRCCGKDAPPVLYRAA